MKLLSTPMGVAPSGPRVWVRWLVLAVFVVALAIAFVNLGFWQLDRLEARRARNDAVAAHENAAPVDFASVFTRQITEADQWQRVQVRGSFDPERQFLVRYRSNAGVTGYEVVTPLRTTTGAWVLVDRGFAPKPASSDYPSVLPAPPPGEVAITGYVRRDEQGSSDAMTPLPPTNTVRLVNSATIGATLPYPIVNGYLSLREISPAQAGGLVPVEPPPADEGNHFSYASQWFMFAGLAGLGLVVLIRSDLRAARRPATAGPGQQEAP